jgi:hypothetical protein
MARVTSQKTRQGILTTDSPWNPNLIPEKLALFDVNGNPISLTGAGIPIGGAVGQVLGKIGVEDFNTGWVNPPEGGGGASPTLYNEAVTYELGDQVIFEDLVYEAVSDPTGWAPDDPPISGGPPPMVYGGTWEAKELSLAYQDTQVTTAEPVVAGATRGGPVDLWAFKAGTAGTYAIRTIPRISTWDAYLTVRKGSSPTTIVGADDDGAGQAHPLVIIGAADVGEIYYCLFHAFSGTGLPSQVSSIKVEVSSGGSLGVFGGDELNPWQVVDVSEVSLPPGGTTGQVLAKASDEDGDAEWVTPGISEGIGSGGYKGIWASDVIYPAGSIVKHDGTSYGSVIEIEGAEPGVPLGSNWGVPVGGGATIQATTADRIDEDVPKIITLDASSPIGSSGSRLGVVALDCVNPPTINMPVQVQNNTNEQITFDMKTMAGASLGNISTGGLSPVAAGANVARSLNFQTYFGGGTGDFILFFYGQTGGVFGDVILTVTGVPMVAPDPVNPWESLT